MITDRYIRPTLPYTTLLYASLRFSTLLYASLRFACCLRALRACVLCVVAPPVDDILRARIQTLGVAEHVFEMNLGRKSVTWRLFDVGLVYSLTVPDSGLRTCRQSQASGQARCRRCEARHHPMSSHSTGVSRDPVGAWEPPRAWTARQRDSCIL